MKYRRKPVVVEAKPFLLDKRPWPHGVRELKFKKYGLLPRSFQYFGGTGAMGSIKTISVIQIGDWVVTEPGGARYVVPMLEFYDTYEPVSAGKELADA